MSTNEGPAKTDAADVAGGEAVFSSDGLAPLPVPRVPPATAATTDESGDTILDTGEALMDPSEAHKTYSSPSSSVPPELRLFQLQQQVAALEVELQSDNHEDLSQQAAVLAERLQQHVMRCYQTTKTTTETSANDHASSSTLETAGTTPDSSLDLEQRLLRLERALGATTSTPPSSSSSLLTRILHMESMLERVDDKALDEYATRAKVIRSDLEAASKAKAKLSSNSTANSKQESVWITELHQQMQELVGVSKHLPALATRLQQLASLHLQASTFQTRLSTTEQVLQQTQASLTNMEQVVERVEGGFQKNKSVMDANMKQLEERMTGSK